MNLIKVLLGNLAPTQLFATSRRDYSDPGFEPLPNHEKKLSRHVKFCFSCCSGSVNKLLYPGLWGGAEATNVTPMLSLKSFTCQPSWTAAGFQACLEGGGLQRLTDEKWAQTERQQSINASLTFEPQSYNKLFFHASVFEQRPCLHWTINRERGGRRKDEEEEEEGGKKAYQRLTQERQLIISSHGSFFPQVENLHLRYLFGIQPKLILSVGKITSNIWA